MSVIQRSGNKGVYYGSLLDSSGVPTEDQQKANMTYIYRFLTAEGWSVNAIAAMIGNMIAESALNPGRWQSDNVGNTSSGYGLVQWTPASNYINWVYSEGYSDPSEMDTALRRIIYEKQTGAQWIATSEYNFSFSEFAASDSDVGELAAAFLLNYERPADQSASVQAYRAALASIAYTYLTGSGGGSGGGISSRRRKKKFNFVLFGKKVRQ